MENVVAQAETLPKEERVDFWTRLGAYLIDFVFIIVFGIVIGLAIGDLLAPVLFAGQIEQFAQMPSEVNDVFPNFYELMFKVLEIGAGTSIAGLILLILEGSLGQSVGKMLLKIRVSDVYGKTAEPKALWIRALLKYGSTVLGLLGGMTGLMAFSTLGSVLSLVIFVGCFLVFMDSRQSIHDMAAKTIITKKS